MAQPDIDPGEPGVLRQRDQARPPAISRSQLGRELKRLRQSSSLRIEDVATRLEVAPSTLSRIETGKAPARASYLATMLTLYGIDDAGQRKELEDLAWEGRRKSWWAGSEELLPLGFGRYLDLETAASHLWSFSAQAIPGLLQTEHYAAAICRINRPGLTTDQLHALITLQARRQDAVLCSGGRCLDMILDESVLVRSVGSARVMAQQREHLFAIAAHPSVTLRVVELSTIQRVLSSSFTILRLAGPASYDMACRADDNAQVTFTGDAARLRALHETFDALRQTAKPLRDTRIFTRKTQMTPDREPAMSQATTRTPGRHTDCAQTMT